MKKKLISLIAASSMIATASVGLVQTAYAAAPGISIQVADGATEGQKVLTFYYEGVTAMVALGGTLTLSEGTINSVAITIPNDNAQADKNTGYIGFASFQDEGTSSADGSYATATITVPTDKEVTVTYTPDGFTDVDWVDYNVAPIIVKIGGAPAITPAAVTAVEKQNSVAGTEEYAAQKADIYGVEITPNDESVKGAEVAFGEKKGTLDFSTVYSGPGTVVFAVILASESGDALPTLTADNVTPITANVE